MMEYGVGHNAYAHLIKSVRDRYGYDFSQYAETSIKRRIAHFMQSQRINRIEFLEDKLLNDESMFEAFVQGMSVTVTQMFRDPMFFKSLRQLALKRLSTYPLIKIWIAGCATGEEVYSVAILLREIGLLDRSLIYATDMNQQSLQIAKQGIYTIDAIKQYTANYIASGGTGSFSSYYQAKFDAVLMDKRLKNRIIFSQHNLTADASFNEFQLILCRNVLMYFKRLMQNRIVTLFHDSLCHFGLLGLGDKESLMFSETVKLFVEIDRRQKIYMKVN